MDANESFEVAAEAFYKATGMLMPGKAIPAAGGWTEDKEEERRKLFKVWGAAVEYMKAAEEKDLKDTKAALDLLKALFNTRTICLQLLVTRLSEAGDKDGVAFIKQNLEWIPGSTPPGNL